MSTRSVFIDLIETAKDGREEKLNSLIRDNPELEKSLRDLLQIHQLLEPTTEVSPTFTEPIQEYSVADTALPIINQKYQPIQRIGNGSSGEVWKALASTSDNAKIVAVKLLLTDYNTPECHQRFDLEVQTLKKMEHPGIAHHIDHGVTENGTPFLVTEYVGGLSFIEHCNVNHLHLLQRLSLFSLICNSVSYAHSRRIVHRDLKPSNILVSPLGDAVYPRLIDFGIAKDLSRKHFEVERPLTTIGTLVGTLDYLSPEQAHLGRKQVDHRSDIFSLGILLFESITGTTPLALTAPNDSSPLDLLQLICDAPPPLPSEVLKELPNLAEIAQLQLASSPLFLSLVREFLDPIVAKATAKDPEVRYQTTEELANSVDAAIQKMSTFITTAEPRRRPKDSKLFSRNALLIPVLLGVIYFIWNPIVSHWRNGNDLLPESVSSTSALASTDPSQLDNSGLVIDRLNRELIRIDALANEPNVDQRHLHEQLNNLSQALEEFSSTTSGNGVEKLIAHQALRRGKLWQRLGDYKSAYPQFELASERFRSLYQRQFSGIGFATDYCEATLALAKLKTLIATPKEAETLLSESSRTYSRWMKDKPNEKGLQRLKLRNDLALAEILRNDNSKRITTDMLKDLQALALQMEPIELDHDLRKSLADFFYYTAKDMFRQGNIEGSSAQAQFALEIAHGDSHPAISSSCELRNTNALVLMGDVLVLQFEPHKAVALFEQAEISIYDSAISSKSPLEFVTTLQQIKWKQGHAYGLLAAHHLAEEAYLMALELAISLPEESLPDNVFFEMSVPVLSDYRNLLSSQGMLLETLALQKVILEFTQQQLSDHPQTSGLEDRQVYDIANLGRKQFDAGKIQEARETLLLCLKELQQLNAAEELPSSLSRYRVSVLIDLAEIERLDMNYAAAMNHLSKAYQQMKQMTDLPNPQLPDQYLLAYLAFETGALYSEHNLGEQGLAHFDIAIDKLVYLGSYISGNAEFKQLYKFLGLMRPIAKNLGPEKPKTYCRFEKPGQPQPSLQNLRLQLRYISFLARRDYLSNSLLQLAELGLLYQDFTGAERSLFRLYAKNTLWTVCEKCAQKEPFAYISNIIFREKESVNAKGSINDLTAD